jgi:farnesyl-diphosphate farnesyltransferase
MAAIQADAMRVLEETSRTFFLPIERLPKGLKEAVAAGYLCLRAIDEVEDHPYLEGTIKASVLQAMSLVLQAQTSVENFAHEAFDKIFESVGLDLPEVTTRIGEWSCYAPKFIAPRVWEATAAMADRMAQWAINGFKVTTKADLDRYTYGVAGAVGLLLCDLWGWFEKIQIDRSQAIQFGRGLQLVNILRNRKEDLTRGVDFYPEGWTDEDMLAYSLENLDAFDVYAQTLPRSTFKRFVRIPRALAYATLDVIQKGREKLSRDEVVAIVSQLEVNP